MAKLRNPLDPPAGLAAGELYPGMDAPPIAVEDQTSPQAPQSNDRQAFQKDWMSTSGTMEDFMASHPQYSDYVKPKNGSKDVYNLGGDESLDLLGDVGGKNAHNWTGTGFNAQGVADKPAGASGGYGPQGNLPPAFGSLQDYMSGGQGSGQAQKANPFGSDLSSALKGLFPGGAFNQDLVNRRTENASDAMNRNMKSRTSTDRAMLADRGLLGSGPEQTAQNQAEEALQGQFRNDVSGIYADESGKADQRMMQALQLAAGMSAEDARMAVEWFRAQTDQQLGQGQLELGNKNANNSFALGQGDLALGNMNGVNNYNLGLANYGLSRNKMLADQSNTDIDQLLKILESLGIGSQTSSGGYY